MKSVEQKINDLGNKINLITKKLELETSIIGENIEDIIALEKFKTGCSSKIYNYESEINDLTVELRICELKVKDAYTEFKKFTFILDKIIAQEKLKKDSEESILLEEINQKLHNF